MRKVNLLFSILILMLITCQVNAKKYTSDGNGDWSDKQMWLPRDGPPTTGDSVIIQSIHTITISTPVECLVLSNLGTLNLNSQLTIGSRFVDPYTGYISSTNGSLIINGNGNGGTLYFKTGSQTLTNLTLNRASSGYITLGTNLTVSGTLTLSNGNIITGTNTLTLGTSTSSTGNLVFPTLPSNASYIVGNFERWISASTGTYYFPTGTTNYYRPVTLIITSAPSTGGRLLFSGFDSNPGTQNTSYLNDGGYSLDRYSNEAWWKATNNGITGITYSINLGAFAISGVDPTNYTRLRVIKRVDQYSLWTLEGTHSDAEGSTGFRTVKRTGLTSFSEFGIAGLSSDGNTLNNSPLPVTLKTFTASNTGRSIILNWTTEKEVNNKGFEVERAIINKDKAEFRKIGFVEGKGNGNQSTIYTFEDKNLSSGTYKYRLKQIDYNGNYEYFELNGEVTVGIPLKFNLSQNFPNPFNPVTKIQFDLPVEGNVSIIIYDILGREIKTAINEFRSAGYYTIEFDASGLSSGMYFYKIKSGNFSAIKKMILIK